MNEYNYPTAYVAGVTKIPIRTIQEYVSSFREHFSETASQAKKGRRFLPGDIDKLQTIQRLRAERMPDDEISKILAGELPFKLAHQFRDDEIKNMAANSLEIFARAEKTIEEAGEMLHDAQRMATEARNLQGQTRLEIQTVRNELRNIGRTMQKFREWQLFVMKYATELNPYNLNDPNEPTEADPEEPITQEAPKKGIIGRLLGD